MNGESVALDPRSFIGRREKDNRGDDECQHDDDNQKCDENSLPVPLGRVTRDELLEQHENDGYLDTLTSNVSLYRVFSKYLNILSVWYRLFFFRNHHVGIFIFYILTVQGNVRGVLFMSFSVLSGQGRE